MRLSEARVGDQLHLLWTQRKLALRWLIYHSLSEDVSMAVTSLSPRTIQLSAAECVINVPAWVARETLVHLTSKCSALTTASTGGQLLW